MKLYHILNVIFVLTLFHILDVIVFRVRNVFSHIKCEVVVSECFHLLDVKLWFHFHMFDVKHCFCNCFRTLGATDLHV